MSSHPCREEGVGTPEVRVMCGMNGGGEMDGKSEGMEEVIRVERVVLRTESLDGMSQREEPGILVKL